MTSAYRDFSPPIWCCKPELTRPYTSIGESRVRLAKRAPKIGEQEYSSCVVVLHGYIVTEALTKNLTRSLMKSRHTRRKAADLSIVV